MKRKLISMMLAFAAGLNVLGIGHHAAEIKKLGRALGIETVVVTEVCKCLETSCTFTSLLEN